MKILWVGDAVAETGFAKNTHEVLDRVCQDNEVVVLGINYNGDPYSASSLYTPPVTYDYPIYSCFPGGDLFGTGRLVEMCVKHRPEVIVLLNDGWNIQPYIKELKQFKEFAEIPVVGVIAVDGKNFRKEWLDGLTHVVFWTDFALNEAREAGYTGPATVIPLGVDLSVYYPQDKRETRLRHFGVETPEDLFVVGNVNRNQPRKRWDLTVKFFAEWVHSRGITNAMLYLHAAPTGETGVDLEQLKQYYCIADKLLIRTPPMWTGDPVEKMRDTYNVFDVAVTTTQGEGFGLTALEAMACRVPLIAPAWSALGELCKDVAALVPCTGTAVGPPYKNIIGGVADQAAFTEMLDAFYQHHEWRDIYGKLGLQRVEERRFNWNVIAQQYIELLESLQGSTTPTRELQEVQ